MSPSRGVAIGMVLLSSTSLQAGLAVASTVFVAAGPLAAVWIRSLVGAVLLGLLIRPDLRSLSRAQVLPVIAYAVALTGVTTFAYLAIERTPLGVVSAIVMLGPLAIAVAGSRSPVDLACVGLAATGALVLSLAHGTAGPMDPLGIVFSLLAATSLGAYIVAGKRVAQRIEGLGGLVLALFIVAALQTPLGLAFAGPDLWSPSVLVTLAVAGVLATLIPFSLEMTALRTLSMATFGLLLAFEPAIAAIAGVIIRGDSLSTQQIIGIALIVVAGAITLGPRGWTRRLGRYNLALMADPKVEALSRVPLFAGVSTRDLATIAAVAEERASSTGTVLTREGEPGDEFFIVADGHVAIEQGGRAIRTLGPGDYLGEVALVFGGTRTATATVIDDARLLVLGAEAFTAMLRRDPRLEDRILTTVSERMRYR